MIFNNAWKLNNYIIHVYEGWDSIESDILKIYFSLVMSVWGMRIDSDRKEEGRINCATNIVKLGEQNNDHNEYQLNGKF